MKINNRTLTPKKLFLILYDTAMAILVGVLTDLLMWQISGNFGITEKSFYVTLLTFISALLVFSIVGLYSQMWAYASILQYLLVPFATGIQSIIFGTIRVYVLGISISLVEFFLYYCLLTFALIGIRVVYRLYMGNRVGLKERIKLRRNDIKMIRVLIVGAGKAGSRMAEDLKEINGSRFPVAFVDDNPKKHNYQHMGIPVLGGRNDIPLICETYGVDEIIFAIPSLERKEVREIINICQKTHCRIRILPSVVALTEDKVGFRDVKDIDIDDLLGRTPITNTSDTVAKMLRDKVILVTGGGGSIGSEICRQVMKCQPQLLVIVDIYENNVYDLQQELISKYGREIQLKVLVASVRDRDRLREIFTKYKPQIVYHAAAHKHVPLMEDSPEEAMKNNVEGTYNVVKISAEYGAERFVLISTDKAVNPTSVMGASKRLAEMTVLAVAKKFPNLKCAMVRFGNVLGSNGSVVPLFKRQIAYERRVTVTHPEMRRYFMTIPEAVSLVLQASEFADHGEIFVLDMGEPVKILDLAKTMIKLSGYEPNVDIPIEFVGLRPGEKMFEELYFDRESLDKTSNDKIMRLRQVEDIQILSKEIDKLFSMFGHEYPEIKQGILNKITMKK